MWAASRSAGADMMRGGAFKPRTSPYAFQGLGLQGLKILEKAREETGLIIEVHNQPEKALCDADQALTPEMFSGIMSQVRPLRAFLENSAPAYF
jgi:3-deoxy-D-arabino-heptulosonate 7-phosphate (DAHP) synthase